MEHEASPRFPRKRTATVTIEVPAPLAEALVNYGDQLIEALRGLREETETAEREARRERERLNRARIRAWQCRAWRYLRRHRQDGETERDACRRLHLDLLTAYPHPLNHGLTARDVHSFIAVRRQHVERYIDRRRALAAGRMVVAGWTNKAIAARLGYSSTSSVKRLLDKHPDSIPKAQDGRLLRTPRAPRSGL